MRMAAAPPRPLGTRCPIGGDLGGPDLGRADGPLEEPVGGRGISPSGEEHVDDLPELVDRSIDVAPLPSHVHIGLVDLPAVTDRVPTRPSGLGQQRREPQHPPVDRDVIDLDPAFGEEFFDVAVGQGEAQVPADREDDDIRWETEAGKGGPRSGSRARAAGSDTGSLAARKRSRGCNSALQAPQRRAGRISSQWRARPSRAAASRRPSPGRSPSDHG
jgi:hypothetical protein